MRTPTLLSTADSLPLGMFSLFFAQTLDAMAQGSPLAGFESLNQEVQEEFE